MKIPNRRIRRWVAIGVFFAVSLIAGRVVETVLHEQTLKQLHESQAEWIETVRAFTPLELVSGYIEDARAVAQGQWGYEAPEARPSVIATDADAAERIFRCRPTPSSGAMGGDCLEERMAVEGSAIACLTDPDRTGCAAYLACIAKPKPTSPPGCAPSYPMAPISIDASPGVEDSGFGLRANPLIVPFGALVRGAQRMMDAGPVAVFIAALQLAFGLAAFLILTAAFRKSGEPGFGNGWANWMLGPLTVFGLGSLGALALQVVMLAALYLFSWITGFAAWAAGATGLAGACWYCFTKVAEKTVESGISR